MADVGSSLYPVFLAKSDDKAALGHSHQTKNPLDLPNSKNGMGKKGQGLNNKKHISAAAYITDRTDLSPGMLAGK